LFSCRGFAPFIHRPAATDRRRSMNVIWDRYLGVTLPSPLRHRLCTPVRVCGYRCKQARPSRTSPNRYEGKSNEGLCRDTYLACFNCGRRSRVPDLLDDRRLHQDIRQDDVAGPNCHQAGNPGLETEPGQKGFRRTVQQGLCRTTGRHGNANSHGTRAPEGVLGQDQVAAKVVVYVSRPTAGAGSGSATHKPFLPCGPPLHICPRTIWVVNTVTISFYSVKARATASGLSANSSSECLFEIGLGSSKH